MKLTITTLVIVEGSYIQGIFHSLEEHPGKAYQELVDQVENEYGYDADKDHVPLHFKTIQDIKNYFLIPIPFILMTMLMDSLLMTLPTTSRFTKSREDEPFDEFLGYIITYASEKDLFENLRENLIRMDLTKGADDQYYDYSPSQVEAILFGILQLTPKHQDIIVIDLKKHLKSFIQDKDQAEEMITQYTCYYNAIKRWESNHKETEILHQLEISNLLEQLKNN